MKVTKGTFHKRKQAFGLKNNLNESAVTDKTLNVHQQKGQKQWEWQQDKLDYYL